MSKIQLPQPDISEVINDLSTQVANLVRDNAIQRSIISQLNNKVLELEKTYGSTDVQNK